jgi:DNA polymerase II
MIRARGWLLDIFDDRREGVVLWLIGDDNRRLRLHQPFPITFYVAGENNQLRAFWLWLQRQPEKLQLQRGLKRDLFIQDPVIVLEVTVLQAAEQPGLFRRAARDFPDLNFYDVDIQLSLRYAAVTGIFPMIYCEVEAQDDGTLRGIRPLETRWELDPETPDLRVLRITPDCEPAHSKPGYLTLHEGKNERVLPLAPAGELLTELQAVLKRYDPDVILTAWGDTWLIPHLLELCQQTKRELSLNREPGRSLIARAERTYFSYGQIIYKGRQQRLYGRCHIDIYNAIWADNDIEGTIESARVTGLPLQVAARTSPGTGISSMEILTALKNQILVPWHKQQAEYAKTALDLLRYDQGGMIYQPLVGMHADVGNIDFTSMYPSVMVASNISPELPPPDDLGVSSYPPGLVPQTLEPLLKKRIALKQRISSLPDDESFAGDKKRSQALKWLLVTCFGYLGYRNARFGRIEAHEAVTTWGREAVLRAKEAAEEMGFEILHLYVDGLWVRKEGCRQPIDYQPLLEEIAQRTHLPVGLDGIFRWIAFLPSRVDERISVPNRYFGMFQDGSLKIRGVDLRRRDTPEFVCETQYQLLKNLTQAKTAAELPGLVSPSIDILRQRLLSLRAHQVSLDQLLVEQKLSRELAAYRDPSPAARAAAQLLAVGKTVRPGQPVRFLLVRGRTGVYAWDLPTAPDPRTLDIERYITLTIRAASNIFQPLGVSEADLRLLTAGQAKQLPLPYPRFNR